MSRRTRFSLVAVSFCWMLVGCGVGGNTPPVAPQTDSGVPKTDGQITQKLQPPTVDPVSNTVCGDSVPLQGTAAAGSSVFVVGGGATSGIATDAHPTTGRFCLDIPLKKGMANDLEVRAQDPVLGLSEAVKITVTQGSCQDDITPPPTEEVKPKNVALGVKARASKAADKGNEGFLTDGNSSTVTEYSGGDWYNPFADANVWITFKLEKLTELSRIVVRWDGSAGTSFGGQYKVLVSSMSDPGDPNLNNGYWTEIANITAGDGGSDDFDLKSSKPVAQHVAVWMLKDGNNGMTGYYEYFRVAEIEAYDAPKKQTPTTPTNNQTQTCANVGSN